MHRSAMSGALPPRSTGNGDAQLPARPGVGAQEDIIREVEGHDRLIGRVLLELLLQGVGVVQHVREPLFAQHSDDGAPGLPRQRDRSHPVLRIS
jgi:hypothetical protein